MNWSNLLKSEMSYAYKVVGSLMDLVEDDRLGWKPPTGDNWMSTGQLLMHVTSACGGPFKGFVTGDWGMPAGATPADMKPEEMLPSAETMASVSSVAEAKKLLAEDEALAFEMLARCSEQDLATRPTPAPWDPTPRGLGERLLGMVEHLKQHKGQLFYYLKLQGKPVNTMHLWGM